MRESRRIVGEYRLTAEDIAFCRKQDDVIAISNHGYDIHNFESTGNIKWAPIVLNGEVQYVISNAGGFGTTTPPPDGKPVVNAKGQTAEFAEFEANLCYDIPYRCLVPARVQNLLAAGRNLSSDVHAQSGARLILCCLAMGEAAGVAACISLAAGVAPRDIDVKALQSELIRTGGNLGQALLEYDGFSEFGLNLLAGFDIHPGVKYSKTEKPIYSMNRLRSFCRTHAVSIGIITVPAEAAQDVCDHLVECGIGAIWNFAPVQLTVPDHVVVQNENLAVSLTALRIQFLNS